MATQGVRHLVGSCEGADGRAADTCDGSAHRLAGEHLVEIDNAIHVGERHAQGAADFRSNGFGQPAVELLCKVQRRQERSAPLRRQLGEYRAQANEISFRHRI